MIALFTDYENNNSYNTHNIGDYMDIRIMEHLPPRGSMVELEDRYNPGQKNLFRIYKYKKTNLDVEGNNYTGVIVYVDQYMDPLDIEFGGTERICDPELASKIKQMSRTSKIQVALS